MQLCARLTKDDEAIFLVKLETAWAEYQKKLPTELSASTELLIKDTWCQGSYKSLLAEYVSDVERDVAEAKWVFEPKVAPSEMQTQGENEAATKLIQRMEKHHLSALEKMFTDSRNDFLTTLPSGLPESVTQEIERKWTVQNNFQVVRQVLEAAGTEQEV